MSLLPQSVKILGKTYTITPVPPKDPTLWYSTGKREGGYADGSVSFDLQQISINGELHEDRQEEAFLHEVVHVLSHALCLRLDEDQVHRLAAGLFAVIVENDFAQDR